MENPYAPPRAAVQDIVDRAATFVLAKPDTRLGAAMLDGLIAITTFLVPFLIRALIAAASGRSVHAPNAGSLGRYALLVIGLGAYWCLNMSPLKRNGQTLGKKILGIKIVRSNGAPASLGRIFWLRYVVNYLARIIPLYALIDPVFIFGQSRQCLHDKIADTVVVVA